MHSENTLRSYKINTLYFEKNSKTENMFLTYPYHRKKTEFSGRDNNPSENRNVRRIGDGNVGVS